MPADGQGAPISSGPLGLITPEILRGLSHVFASSLARWHVPADLQLRLTGHTDVYEAFVDGTWLLPRDTAHIGAAIDVLNVRKDLRHLFSESGPRDAWFSQPSPHLNCLSPLDAVRAAGLPGFSAAAVALHHAKRDGVWMRPVAGEAHAIPVALPSALPPPPPVRCSPMELSYEP